MRSQWTDYKGMKIFYANYSGLDEAGLRTEAGYVFDEMKRNPPKSVLLLADARGGIITPAMLEIYSRVSLDSKPYLKKTAVLGVSGVRKTLLDVVVKFSGLEVTAFDDETKAKDWLIQK